MNDDHYDLIGDPEVKEALLDDRDAFRARWLKAEETKRNAAGIAEEMCKEAYEASVKWDPFNSAHEGFAILKEEVDELWDEVKVNQSKRDLVRLRKEAIQVGAMAMRFVADICDGERGRK